MWNAYVINDTPQPDTAFADISNRAFRPPQWSDQSQTIFARTIIKSVMEIPASPYTFGMTYEIDYVFDAILRQEHTHMMRITEHPVQTGANISDHAYQLPATLMLEIGMSDAMDTFFPGQFEGPYSKSVNAYQTLLDLQAKRLPIEISTRLNTYKNMVVEEIRAQDDFKTMYGLRAVVTFKQIITATVASVAVPESDRIHAAREEYQQGITQPVPVTPDNRSLIRVGEDAIKGKSQ